MSDSSQFQGLLVGALAVIIPLFITCFAFLRQFATKTEVEQIEKRVNAHAESAAEANEKIETRVLTEQRELERRITAGMGVNREENAKHFAEHNALLITLQNTLQLFANETSRVVGVLEGKQSMIEQKEKYHAR